jgi:hypothetical protein
VRDRTLELIRVGHVILGPLAVSGVFIAFPSAALVTAGMIYLLGPVSVLVFLPRRRQVATLAMFDLPLIGRVSSLDPTVWQALLVPAVTAMTIG